MHKKIYGFALGALMTAMFVSCNEGINNPDNGDKIITLQLAKNPEIVAWSGSHALTSYSTRADEDGSYIYVFPSDIEKAENIVIPEDTIILKRDNPTDRKATLQSGNKYFIPKDFDGTIEFNNFNGDLYIEGEISQFSGNPGNVNLYILKGGSWKAKFTTGTINIYNQGEVNLPTDALQNGNLRNIYNFGSDAKLIFSGAGNISSNVQIYNKYGYIEFNPGEGNTLDAQGTLISDNIVQVNGNIKFQNFKKDICHLIVTGSIEINQDDLCFGIIECSSLQAQDNRKIKLLKDGYILATGEIFLKNGFYIIPENTDFNGLLVCDVFRTENMHLDGALREGIYLNTNTINDWGNIVTSDEDMSKLLPGIINVKNIKDFHPSCGSQDEPEEKCPWCDHPESECDEDGCGHPECQCPPCKKSDPEPEPPFIPHPDSEVEVNLAINDQHTAQGINDLVSKLSIHVRYPGDVQIFIPIEQKWYCSQDDLYILNNHQEGNFIHGGPETISYNVGGYNVSLTFKYNDNGIYVTTGGINSQVFDHCVRNFGDGINFEVYMYMNDQANLTMDWFKRVLNGSTIKFIDKDEYNVGYPNYYINAFTDHGQGHGWDQDCAVNIIVEQENGFDRGVSGAHLNDSPYNWIYTSQSFLSSFPEDKEWDERVGSHGYHKHTFLWGEDED